MPINTATPTEPVPHKNPRMIPPPLRPAYRSGKTALFTPELEGPNGGYTVPPIPEYRRFWGFTPNERLVQSGPLEALGGKYRIAAAGKPRPEDENRLAHQSNRLLENYNKGLRERSSTPEDYLSIPTSINYIALLKSRFPTLKKFPTIFRTYQRDTDNSGGTPQYLPVSNEELNAISDYVSRDPSESYSHAYNKSHYKNEKRIKDKNNRLYFEDRLVVSSIYICG